MGRYTGCNLGMVEAGLVATYAFHIHDLDMARHALKQCEEKFRNVPDTMRRLAEIKKHLRPA